MLGGDGCKTIMRFIYFIAVVIFLIHAIPHMIDGYYFFKEAKRIDRVQPCILKAFIDSDFGRLTPEVENCK